MTFDDRATVQALLDKFVARLQETFGDNLVSAVLYGSVARGDFKPRSDIDLLVVFESLPLRWPERRDLVYNVAYAVEEEIPQQRDAGQCHHFGLLIKTREQAQYTQPYYLDMTTDARLLYDKGDFFKGVLDRLRARMKELGSKKIYLNERQWYWVLKPGNVFGEVVEL